MSVVTLDVCRSKSDVILPAFMEFEMVEVRKISLAAMPPQDCNWLLIEKVQDKFKVYGSVAGTKDWTFSNWSTHVSKEEALSAARGLADELEIPVVYVRDADTDRTKIL